MPIRPAHPSDLAGLMALYRSAQDFMIETGNPEQWGRAHPPESRIRTDIAEGVGYVLEEEGELLSVFALLPGPDPTYQYIEGAWLSDRPYGVIHRMACARHGQGLGSLCLNWCKERFDCLRIDTHRDNRPMQALVTKNGFLPCGVIYLENGDPRLAYQWEM